MVLTRVDGAPVTGLPFAAAMQVQSDRKERQAFVLGNAAFLARAHCLSCSNTLPCPAMQLIADAGRPLELQFMGLPSSARASGSIRWVGRRT